MIEPSSNLKNTNGGNSDTGNRIETGSLIDFIKFIIRRWWIFAIIGLVAGLAGVYYASKQPVMYESNLTFVIQQESGGNSVAGALGLASQFGLNIGAGEDLFSGDNILEIVTSRRIVEKVLLSVDSFNNKPYTLAEYFLHNPSVGEKNKNSKSNDVHFLPGQQRHTFSYKQDSVLFALYKDFADNYIVADRPNKKLSIFAINVKGEEEKFIKIFTDKLISETDSFYTQISSKKEKETLDILEQRVAYMKGNLSASISSRAAVQDANVNPAFSSSQVPLQKQQANIQVYSGAYGEMFKNLELARYQYLKKIPLIQIIDGAEYPLKKIKLSKLKTAVIFSFGLVFFVIFILWLIRIYKYNF